MEETHEQHKLHGFLQCLIYVSIALEAKRKRAGDINYYHAGEEYQLTMIGKPSLCVNLELAPVLPAAFILLKKWPNRPSPKNLARNS